MAVCVCECGQQKIFTPGSQSLSVDAKKLNSIRYNHSHYRQGSAEHANHIMTEQWTIKDCKTWKIQETVHVKSTFPPSLSPFVLLFLFSLLLLQPSPHLLVILLLSCSHYSFVCIPVFPISFIFLSLFF